MPGVTPRLTGHNARNAPGILGYTIPVLTIGTASLNQCDRSVFPFYITQDPGSGAVTFKGLYNI